MSFCISLQQDKVSCFGWGKGSSHFARKVWICCYSNFFRVRHDIPNKDRFRRFNKMCCYPQLLGLPALGVGQQGAQHASPGSHSMSANRIPLPQAGMRQKDHSFLFLFTQCLGSSGKVQVLCKSLSHIHYYGNVVSQSSTSSLPPAVTFSCDRG